MSFADILLMTPGPTYVHEDVRAAMAKPITNPDIDPAFYEFYRETCDGLKRLMKTDNDVLILGGEGILGLEAACASLIEPGDRVLCIDNGIFGKGFGDFEKLYGAEVIYFSGDYQKPIDIDELEAFLYADSRFKLATVVHCETPSGITNPIDQICPMLKKNGILTVVDSVSGIGGENIEVDNWKVDIALGGSQKCLSAPPGLTFLSISKDAYAAMEERCVPIAGFYCNLLTYKGWYEGKWFPYTQSISDIYALRVALDRLLGEGDWVLRHTRISEAVRKSLEIAGLTLYAKAGFSTTVTAVELPEGIAFEQLYDELLNDHGIMIGGAFDYLKGKIFRIGHMGENCREEKLYLVMKALGQVLTKHNVKINGELHKHFVINMK